jgi:hypothetical protein
MDRSALAAAVAATAVRRNRRRIIRLRRKEVPRIRPAHANAFAAARSLMLLAR